MHDTYCAAGKDDSSVRQNPAWQASMMQPGWISHRRGGPVLEARVGPQPQLGRVRPQDCLNGLNGGGLRQAVLPRVAHPAPHVNPAVPLLIAAAHVAHPTTVKPEREKRAGKRKDIIDQHSLPI